MGRVWEPQEAGNKLSEVVAETISSGPQVITRRGEEVVVVLSARQFRQLVPTPGPLSAFFRASPLAGIGIDLSRDKSPR